MKKNRINGRNILLDSRGRPLPMGAGYGYDNAETTRYNMDFTTTSYSAAQLVNLSARTLRARAQHLERNSDHVRRFLALAVNNIVGWSGIRLQSKATRSEKTDTPDRNAIRLIEESWLDWASDPTACGGDSLIEVEDLICRRWLVDGEVFVEHLPGFDNDYRFAIRVWEADSLPIGYIDEAQRIYNGIQYDPYMRPVAYYFNRTGYAGAAIPQTDELIRVDARRISHLFTRERPAQRRGITALASTAERVHMLNELEKSVLIGTRIAASKMGFFRDSDGQTLPTYIGDGQESPDSLNNTIDIQPGQFEDIGHKQFQAFDVNYPMANYEPYIHEIIRSAASGLNMSYHLIANDPGSVNYSTAREFRLQDTDEFKKRQYAIVRKVMQPMFHAWLNVQMLLPAFARYSVEDYKRLSYHKFQPRGWQWVDPQKEASGNMLAVQMGVKSLTDIAAEQGRDYEEVIEQIQRDKEYADQHGVDLRAVWSALNPGEETTATPDQET